IDLQDLTKVFPGTTAPAVDRLSLHIERGEIVVFVGPSGCGKTTTLKMINRLVEPTSGTIRIDGRSVDAVPVHQLRRGIGYVIQQVGLFPHRTIRQNMATVPGLLDWDKKRTAERVDELTDLVALDPDILDRYPAELSGGQRQRVGVARALAADPPVLLMDEPFGAVDPIVRAHLQDELLDLQRRLHKTIALVTHDIDEAIKMGDRVAILSEGGHLEQYGSPADILRDPANAFVADFLGTDRGIKRLSLIPISDLTLETGPVVDRLATHAEAVATALEYGTDWIAVSDGSGVDGWVRIVDIPSDGVATVRTEPFQTRLTTSSTLKEALDAIVSSHTSVAAVFDGSELLGMITAGAVSREILR
ncbi:MAG: ABC transporter ATP-binding protein, partial [Actinomycetota bacterium]|nr:ABC transporter ATP-binding protein [Actinomycetota bacterium]